MLNYNQIIRAKYLAAICSFILSSGHAIASTSHVNEGTYSFSGNVIATPCQIAPGSEKVLVDFEKVSVKELYLNGKTKPLPFSIHLTNCNISVFKAVTVTFDGTINPEIPNHLEINSKSMASGIGIGLLNYNDMPIKLSSPSLVQNLTNNNSEIKFKAYVIAEPKALENKTITYGDFYSTAYYTLNYQ